MSRVAPVVVTRTGFADYFWCRLLFTCSVGSTHHKYYCLNEAPILQFSPDDTVPYQQPPDIIVDTAPDHAIYPQGLLPKHIQPKCLPRSGPQVFVKTGQ